MSATAKSRLQNARRRCKFALENSLQAYPAVSRCDAQTGGLIVWGGAQTDLVRGPIGNRTGSELRLAAEEQFPAVETKSYPAGKISARGSGLGLGCFKDVKIGSLSVELSEMFRGGVGL